MDPAPSTTETIFNLTWRYLSHAAIPAMLPSSALDANGSIPRSFCPEVYDGVRKTVGEMREEGQWAVWYWVVGPGDGEAGGVERDGGDGRDDGRERVGWHPCFRLPANRRVVTRNVLTSPTSLPPTSLPYPTTSNTDTSPPPRRRSISSSSYLSTNPDHHIPNPNPRSTHSRRSSADTTRRMSSVREESKSEEGSVEAASESVSERIRKSSSLHVRPGMVRK